MRAPMRPVVIQTRPLCMSCVYAGIFGAIAGVLLLFAILHFAPDVWGFLVVMAK